MQLLVLEQVRPFDGAHSFERLQTQLGIEENGIDHLPNSKLEKEGNGQTGNGKYATPARKVDISAIAVPHDRKLAPICHQKEKSVESKKEDRESKSSRS